jgi:hypothetical protein
VTYEQWEEEKDRELDERLTTLFRGAVPPQPRAGFANRTLKAIRREPLAPGRRPLRQPWTVPIGWAALIGGTTGMAYFIMMNLPLFGGLFTRVLAGGIGVGVWFVHFIGTGLAISNLFTTTGLAVARVVATREGSAGLMLMAVIGALSLSALHRLLFAEGEASQWQRVS